MSAVNYLLLFTGMSDQGGHEATVRSFMELPAARLAMIESYQQITAALNIPAGPHISDNRYATLDENSIRLERGSDIFRWEIIKAIPEDFGPDRSSSADSPSRLRKYTVTIEEHIAQEFPVKAYDLSHALETAEAAYKQGELVVQPSAPTTRLIMARHNKTGKTTGWREF